MPRLDWPEIQKVKKEMGKGIVQDYDTLRMMSQHNLLALIATILLQDKRNLVTADEFRR